MERGRIRLLMREAIQAARSGNKNWARECLERVLKADPRNEEAWLWLSAVLDTVPEKRYCLERVLAINPANAQAAAGLRYLEEQARVEAGRPQTRRTVCPLCGEPNDPNAFQCANCGQDLFVLCPACGERVDIDRPACAACGLEIGDSSDGAAYFFHLGELYLRHGQPKRALDAWDKTLLLNPDYPRVAEVAAEAFMASGQRELALQSLQRALEEAGDEEHRRTLRLRMANFQRDLGNLEEAGRLYQELLREDRALGERRADLYIELGRFHQKRGETERARNYYEMALALDEDLPEIRYALAEILLAQGYETRALDEFRHLARAGGELGERAVARIRALRPPVPEEFRHRWQETVRGAGRFFLASLLLLLLNRGREWAASPAYSPAYTLNLVGLLATLAGGYLLSAAMAAPRHLPGFSLLIAQPEGRLAERLQARRKSREPRRPAWVARIQAQSRRSAQAISEVLKVVRLRLARSLERTATALSRAWKRVGAGPLAWLRRQGSHLLNLLGKVRLFRSVAFSFRRLFPRRAGLSLLERLKRPWQEGRQVVGRVELSEADLYRWGAGLVGLVLVVLGAVMVLS